MLLYLKAANVYVTIQTLILQINMCSYVGLLITPKHRSDLLNSVVVGYGVKSLVIWTLN